MFLCRQNNVKTKYMIILVLLLCILLFIEGLSLHWDMGVSTNGLLVVTTPQVTRRILYHDTRTIEIHQQAPFEQTKMSPYCCSLKNKETLPIIPMQLWTFTTRICRSILKCLIQNLRDIRLSSFFLEEMSTKSPKNVRNNCLHTCKNLLIF